jgi:hypothetical protein
MPRGAQQDDRKTVWKFGWLRRGILFSNRDYQPHNPYCG